MNIENGINTDDDDNNNNNNNNNNDTTTTTTINTFSSVALNLRAILLTSTVWLSNRCVG